MARISAESIDRVRDAVDMVELVSGKSELRRQGDRWVGLCPFHEERTPSFSVNANDKLYYCFGCEAGGNVFRFVEETEGLDFAAAVESLADRYGVELAYEDADPRAEERRRRRARLHEALERAAAFYATYLWESEKAAKVRTYLLDRGLAESALRNFGIGMAPSGWDSLLVKGQQAGYSVDELTAAGLVRKGRHGHYDRFRSRITFPLRDARGRIVGFGARRIGEGEGPKYLNSPEGELFHKGKLLYGFDRARASIGRSGRAVVVEGYTDVIAAHDAGISEAVAVMGTAITADQLRTLGSMTREVVLALDADRAGREAMLRAQRVAGSDTMRLRVAAMPPGEDPAEMLGRGEREKLESLIDRAEDLGAFHLRKICDEGDLTTPEGRDRALDEAVPVLRSMRESITREEALRALADRLEVDPALITRRIAETPKATPAATAGGERGTPAQRGPGPETAAARSATPRQRRERWLLVICVSLPPARRAEALAKAREEWFDGELERRARSWLHDHPSEPTAGLPDDDPQLVSLVSQVVARAENDPIPEGALDLALAELEKSALEDEIGAQQSREGAADEELIRRRSELANQIASRR